MENDGVTAKTLLGTKAVPPATWAKRHRFLMTRRTDTADFT